jgi:3D (Asp-Asp-Asp) domain-containing protein
MKWVLIIYVFFCTSFIKVKQIEVLVTGYSTPIFKFKYYKTPPYKHKQELIKKGKSFVIWTEDILICEQTKMEGFAYIITEEETLLVEQIKGCLKQSKYNVPVDNHGKPLTAYKSIAVDNEIIKRTNVVLLGNCKLEPTDVGSKINGFHIDLYMGTNKKEADSTRYKKVITIIE